MIQPIYGIVGDAIAKNRIFQDMSQGQLAKRVGLSRGSIANIETGRQRILLHQVELFANAFGIKAKSLVMEAWP